MSAGGGPLGCLMPFLATSEKSDDNLGSIPFVKLFILVASLGDDVDALVGDTGMQTGAAVAAGWWKKGHLVFRHSMPYLHWIFDRSRLGAALLFSGFF